MLEKRKPANVVAVVRENLVDGSVGRLLAVEREPERGLTRRPHDAPGTERGGCAEDVVGADGVVAESLSLRVASRRRDGGKVNHTLDSSQDLERFAQVGQVGLYALAEGFSGLYGVGIKDIVARFQQIAHHRTTSLPASAGYYDFSHQVPFYTPLKAPKPPSTGTTMPFTNLAAGEQSQIRVPTSSSGSPKRPAGVWSTILRPLSVRLPSSLSSIARFCSPRKNPGEMAFALKPAPCLTESSTASQRVRFSTAALAAA